jgi:hypothetical protein
MALKAAAAPAKTSCDSAQAGWLRAGPPDRLTGPPRAGPIATDCARRGCTVFVNRRGSQVKVLYFDRSGWCVWANLLEEGQFIGDRGRVH